VEALPVSISVFVVFLVSLLLAGVGFGAFLLTTAYSSSPFAARIPTAKEMGGTFTAFESEVELWVAACFSFRLLPGGSFDDLITTAYTLLIDGTGLTTALLLLTLADLLALAVLFTTAYSSSPWLSVVVGDSF
jgi:hypothetical protein